ncbi:MAG: PEP-CTERM sorting domain-containing protein [Pirellulaceae bacterium]|nr:PEP-CTERM sorting domain-containing protein [Planctomycetaceae bacterium]MDG2382342.1 PEP-CTERM sorting domain-containing protein [Pirellulaceae bacterium]
MLRCTLLTFGLFWIACGHLHGELVNYNESIDDDLSDNHLGPTKLPESLQNLSVGTHTITGKLVNDLGPNSEIDFWTISIGPDTALTSITIDRYDTTYSPPGNGGFFGVQTGAEISSKTDASALLGAALVGINPGSGVNDDVLDDLGALFEFPVPGANVVSGFEGSLGEGIYSFWFQEGDFTPDTDPVGTASPNDEVEYQLSFEVSVVPEPSTSVMMLGAIGLVGWLRRSRSLKA